MAVPGTLRHASEPLIKAPDAEPIPGYRLIEPIGRGGYGEVWKCEAPGGLLKAIKFVPGSDGLDDEPGPASEELRSIQYIKSLRHPFLLGMERVELIAGELVIVMELADSSLKDVLEQRREAGLVGLERRELLGFLREAADVLDLINVQHGLQHLDVKPANLFVVSDHVKVADFGLVNSLQDRTGSQSSPLGAVTPTYAAPELYRGQISPHCDQYSLAIVYMELLTGHLPFQAKSARQLALLHSSQEPDLAPLLEVERPIIAQALSKDPAARHACCRALIEALEQVGSLGGGLLGSADARASWTGSLPDLTPLGLTHRSTHGETWQARDREGRGWRVLLIQGITERFREGVVRLQALSHERLAPARLLRGEQGELILAQQTGEGSLNNRFLIEKQRGNKGLQRGPLLAWLAQAAEALDELARGGVPHLGLSPRHLFLRKDQIWIADHGLVPLLGLPPAPRYAAPEVVQGRGTGASDVYSLACVYQEMLTGVHPLTGRRLDQPNLGPLPACDLDLIQSALSLDPTRRPIDCRELIAGLEALSPSKQLQLSQAAREAEAREEATPTRIDVGLNGQRRALRDLITEVADTAPDHVADRWQLTPNGLLSLFSVFPAPLPRQNVRALFDAFCQKWNGKTAMGCETSLIFELSDRRPFWRRWLGRPLTLTVELTWQPATPPLSLQPEIRASVRGRCLRGDEQALLRELGPILMDDLRASVQAVPDRRAEKRILFTRPLQASLVFDTDDTLHHIEAQGKDLSLTGVGLFLPPIEPGTLVQINLTSTSRPRPVVLAGRCVRVRPVDEGRYEAGFLLDG